MPDMDLCEIVAIVDRSGSMGAISTAMAKGFNELIEDQKTKPGRCHVTLVQFDTGHIDTLYEDLDIADVPEFALHPRGGTPLLDAVGQTINRVKARHEATAEDEVPGRVLVLIITDGEENASREFKQPQVKAMVEERTRSAAAWEFSYLGANVDAFHEASGLGVSAAASSGYTPDSASVSMAFRSVSASVASYRAGESYCLTDADRVSMGGTVLPDATAVVDSATLTSVVVTNTKI